MGKYVDEMVKKYEALGSARPEVEAAAAMLIACYEAGGKVLICGNGGSAADSEHIAGELLKGFLKKRPLRKEDAQVLGEALASRLQYGLPAIPLVSHPSIITAVVNDLGSDVIFAQQVLSLGNKGDVLIGLSTSGNAADVVNAIRVAKRNGMRTLSLTGMTESRMSELSDICIRVPAQATPDVQELHLPVYHAICAEVEARFFEE